MSHGLPETGRSVSILDKKKKREEEKEEEKGEEEKGKKKKKKRGAAHCLCLRFYLLSASQELFNSRAGTDN
jgi:hypothetical protein